MATERAAQATILTPEETTEPMTEGPEATATEANPEEQYEFHIRLHGTDIDEKLKDAATVAYQLELITKPTLAQLMNHFIGWDLAIFKEQWAGAGRVPLSPARST